MKRYCVGKEYSKNDFLEQDTDKYYGISYRMLATSLLKKTYNKVENQNIARNNIENDSLIIQCSNIPLSLECELDILNDIYLKLLLIADNKEPLFKDIRELKIIKKDRESIISNADINESIKRTINNRKRANSVREDCIFDIEKLTSTKKDVIINSFGAGVVRLWLSSPEFRNLFIKTEKRNEKYKPDKILTNIRGKIERDDDIIIMEKLLGICLEFDIQYNIVNNFKHMEYKDLEPLIDCLVQCEGSYSRYFFLRIIGADLLKCSSNEAKYDRIKYYSELMTLQINQFNSVYLKMLDIIVEEYQKQYSFQTVKDLVMERRHDIRILRHFAMLNDPFYRESIVERNKSIANKIGSMRDKRRQVIEIQELLEPKPIYSIGGEKNNFWRERWYGCFERPDLDEKIQGRIIQKSHEKYII